MVMVMVKWSTGDILNPSDMNGSRNLCLTGHSIVSVVKIGQRIEVLRFYSDWSGGHGEKSETDLQEYCSGSSGEPGANVTCRSSQSRNLDLEIKSHLSDL